MKIFKPVVDKFKNAFFDGDDSDSEPSVMSGRGKGRAQGKA